MAVDMDELIMNLVIPVVANLLVGGISKADASKSLVANST